jgi:hypothetical protein
MRKEPYHCPHCYQTCSRHWNMKVHIQRKHGGIGQQPIGSVSLSTSPEFIPSMSNSDANGRDLHHEASLDYVHLPSESYSNILEESTPLPTPASKEKDASDKLHETIREAIEFKKMLSKQLQSFSPSSSSFLAQLPDTVGLTMSLFSGIKTAPTPNQVNYNSALQFYNVLISNKDVGFRGHICYNCFECWVDLLYDDSEQIKSLINSTNSSLHTCNPKKVVDGHQNAQEIQSKKDELQNVLTDLLLFLTIICWFCVGQNKIYLKTEELTAQPPLSSSSSSPSHPAFDLLQGQNSNFPPRVDDVGGSIEQELRRPSQQYPPSSFWIEEEQEQIESNCNSIDIDLTKVQEKHWAYRAIKEALDDGKSSIEIESSELIDFLKRARATFGIHVTDIGESIRHFFIYLSFK